ncbi:MAG: adenylosuccinate synthetase [Clostridia bacterium]|nr:adenylosuccinate synthetase [Clostridia bacterium]
MKNVKIVIGSLWGDEAKGHLTHILSHSLNNTIVVRFNGGAQASHTVVSDNMVHAFRHHGSGTFNGVPTYLSKHFIVNVFEFVIENDKLKEKLRYIPIVYVNPNAIVTTPYDEIINQEIENMRGDNRHGSCGLGINETVLRCKTEYAIRVSDLFFADTLKQKLERIRDEYVPMRLQTEYGLSMQQLPTSFKERLEEDGIINEFLLFTDIFLKRVRVYSNRILNQFDNVVFEGAQGLLLDQNNKEMRPHLTTSNTGTKNVMEILDALGYDGTIETYYISRVYMTKHGAGPFPHELPSIPYEKFEDKTNVPNAFQGALRFSYMDYDLLVKAINKDLVGLRVNSKVNVVFSCIDQLGESFYYYVENSLCEVKSCDVLNVSKEILRQKLKKLDNVFGINSIDAISLITML